MRLIRFSRSQTRLWGLLFLAFLIVGSSVGIAVYRSTIGQFDKTVRNELVLTARMLSLAVDPATHEKLQSSADMQSPEYRAASQKLAEAKEQATHVRTIYTVRKLPSGEYATVLDPTAAGDHDADGQDDKSYVGEKLPEFSQLGRRVFQTGVAEAEPAMASDRWGKFWAAYAPVTDSKGNVVAVLAFEKDAGEIDRNLSELYGSAYVGFAMILLLSGLFSYILAAYLGRRSDRHPDPIMTANRSRAVFSTLLELGLGCLALTALCVGVGSYSSQGRLVHDREQAEGQLDNLSGLQQYVQDILAQDKPDISRINKLRSESYLQGHEWVLVQLDHKPIKADSIDWRGTIQRVGRELAATYRSKRTELQRIGIEINRLDTVLTSSLLIATLLGLGSLLLVRTAVKNQQELLYAKEETARHQVAYEQVAQNLPIGLYMLRGGEVAFANAAWDSQVNRQPGEDRVGAFLRALHPEDKERLVRTLMTVFESGEPVEVQYRLIGHSGEPLTMESRAVPVPNADGEIEHVLGFVIDVTERVKATRELQAKSEEVQAKNLMLEQALLDLEENFEAMVASFVKAVEAKDPYTGGHSERVMGYSVRIGEALGLDPEDLRRLRIGTLIHDLGKIGIPDAVMLKPGKLTDEEFAIIKLHPVIGADMVSNIPTFREYVPIIRWHHERLDGRGYPDGLAAEQIPLLVRICAVADVFDAMTSTRSYRQALSVDHVIAEMLKDGEANKLDLKLVRILADIVKKEGILWEPPMAA